MDRTEKQILVIGLMLLTIWIIGTLIAISHSNQQRVVDCQNYKNEEAY
jgi:hypothetical protein